MTLQQIKDEIRSLRSSERIELYKWLDYDVATDFCPRIGVDRSLEIRHSIEQKFPKSEELASPKFNDA